MNLVSEKRHHTSARINGDGCTLSTIETPGLKEDSLFRSGRLTNAHPYFVVASLVFTSDLYRNKAIKMSEVGKSRRSSRRSP